MGKKRHTARGRAWRAAAREAFQPCRPSRRHLLGALGLALVITTALVLVGVFARGGLDFLEMALLDARFRARGPRPRPAAVLLLALDDRTMNGARRLSPVPRELLAAIVGRLAADGAKTIVLDVLLPDRLPGQEDARLLEAMAGAGCVILPAAFDARGQLISPSPAFEDAAAGVGLAHVETTAVDHVARWFQPAPRGVPSLALAAAAQFQGWDLNRVLTAVARGGRRRAARAGPPRAGLLIVFVGPPNSIARASAADLLAGRLAPETVRGKLVLVGGVWSGVQDVQFVPFAGWGAALDQSAMTGVELQANCVATLLTRPPLRQASSRRTRCWCWRLCWRRV